MWKAVVGFRNPDAAKERAADIFCVFLEHAFYLTMSPSAAVHARSCNCLVIFALATEQSLAMKSETKYLHICQSLVLLARLRTTQRDLAEKLEN